MARALIHPRRQAAARTLVAGAALDRCDVFHAVTALNALRETVTTYGELPDLAASPCRFAALGEADARAFGETIDTLREVHRIAGVLRFAASADVRPTDRLVLAGVAYRVALVAPVTAFATALVVGIRTEA